MFTAKQVFPGILHITDNMGVSFTLIEGEERAVLFDTGYGMENVSSWLISVTDKPVKVLLSHGHHDHMLGARWFQQTFMCTEDMDEFIERTGYLQRTKVRKQAEDRALKVPSDFMTAEIPLPEPIRFSDKTGPFESMTENLGKLDVQVIRVPGHTPGSIVLFIRKYGVLLTGDDWNPCTWMWFPSSVSAPVWRDNMKTLIELIEKNAGKADTVICSHQPAPRKGSEIKAFLDYMTDERFKSAPYVDMGAQINTHIIREESEDWTLVFDKDKL